MKAAKGVLTTTSHKMKKTEDNPPEEKEGKKVQTVFMWSTKKRGLPQKGG